MANTAHVEIIIVRAPDGGTYVHPFVDGVELCPGQFTEYVIAASAGHTTSEWAARLRRGNVRSQPRRRRSPAHRIQRSPRRRRHHRRLASSRHRITPAGPGHHLHRVVDRAPFFFQHPAPPANPTHRCQVHPTTRTQPTFGGLTGDSPLTFSPVGGWRG